jgi:hypothetical protein
MLMRRWLPLLVLAACSPTGSGTEPVIKAEPTSVAVEPVSEPAPSSAAADPNAPVACGALACTQYPSAQAAFQAVLASKPRVLAIGEAHAQKGTETIATATRRFTETLLPLLPETKSDLVIELLDPPRGCKKAVAEVKEKVEQPVTQPQSQGNQNEFLALGGKAKDLEVRPHVLAPSCEQFAKIADAGADGVVPMMELIANLSGALAMRILERNDKSSVDKGVILYGGAMHNDLVPREGRESFSYGPRLSTEVKGSYVELDLIVPEYIKDNDTWRSLSWYAHYDKSKLGDKVTLFEVSPKSYVLVFAVTR